MLNLPRVPAPGQPLSADYALRLQRGIDGVGGLPGPSLLTRRLREEPLPERRGGGGGVVRYPFDITLTDAGSGNSTATIWPGTINQLLPSNYLTGVTVSNTGTHYLVLDCTASNGEITAAPLAIESAAPSAITPTQGTPPVAFQVLVGIIIDGVAFKVWGHGNMTASAAESYRVDKGSPVPGSLPYDIYYTWEMALV